MITKQTYSNGTYTTVTQSEYRTILINVLYDLGFLDNSYWAEGTYGEFDHDKYHKYTKWFVIALFLIVIIACMNAQKN
ncbi:MAG: hypothetical protein IJS05_07725 [Paludibacteraceae bacterium]|nr:hypothetical protein [Paludibacteraceae bacterium]